jgi:hypothetical protein
LRRNRQSLIRLNMTPNIQAIRVPAIATIA